MPAFFLTESDVRELLTMELAIEAVQDGFRRLAAGEATNVPRQRARTPDVILHTMSAGCAAYGLVGFKAYTTSREGARFHVVLYDGSSGELVAVIEADWLGQVRTGAASGVATQYMARPDSSEVGIFGSGKQARTQLEAMCAVRPVAEARVYSRNEKRRDEFAREMSERCRIPVVPVHRPEEATADMDIVVTATASREPVLEGRLLSEGTHINAIGSNALNRAELDPATIRRADTIVADSVEQCRIEVGDFVAALEQGLLHWSRVFELADIVTGRQTARPTPESITLFKSLGVAIEDLAVAHRVLAKAREAGRGRPLPW
jgi:ornithine cyclodeaminase/alanine dehydrogenase-like protein (mu-crystallin family)